jgi:hypothetical protein
MRIISEWQKVPEPYVKFFPLETMNEKEQAALKKQEADTEAIEASTYKSYVDMGVLEPYEVRFLKFGNTLDNIPAPKELELPPVETLSQQSEEDPQEEPEEGEAQEGGEKPKPPEKKAPK